MMNRWCTVAWAMLATGAAQTALAQSTSLRRPATTTRPVLSASSREAVEYQGNKVLERHSIIAVPVDPPKTFEVYDLITIIVRQQRSFESDATQETKRKFDVTSQLDAFIKFIDGGVGASTFARGKPNIDYRYQEKSKNEGDKDREDRFITRITAEIIDVKPNGNLVLQARNYLKFDRDVMEMTLTGTCRKSDVTPDNTILSTQLADLRIDNQNGGAVRDASKDGWVTRILGFTRPV